MSKNAPQSEDDRLPDWAIKITVMKALHITERQYYNDMTGAGIEQFLVYGVVESEVEEELERNRTTSRALPPTAPAMIKDERTDTMVPFTTTVDRPLRPMRQGLPV